MITVAVDGHGDPRQAYAYICAAAYLPELAVLAQDYPQTYRGYGSLGVFAYVEPPMQEWLLRQSPAGQYLLAAIGDRRMRLEALQGALESARQSALRTAPCDTL